MRRCRRIETTDLRPATVSTHDQHEGGRHGRLKPTSVNGTDQNAATVGRFA